MYKSLIVASLLVLLSGCGDKSEPAKSASTAAQVPTATQQVAPTNDKAALTEQAKGAAMALGGTLKGELEAALQTGDATKALDICHVRAPEIAKSISEQKGMQVSRVSLKNRNPVMGQANDWQTQVLNDFEKRKAAGEDVNTLAYSEIAGNEFRFMKAIPTGAMCLKCHGTEISPDISAKIKTLYPQDKATGFKEGDIRGAFVVVKQLAK